MYPTDIFKCLSDETRLQILLLLAEEGELCVCELTEALEQSQPKISRLLAILKSGQLLVDRRQGQWVFYRLNPSLPTWVVQTIINVTDGNPNYLLKAQQQLHQMGNRPQRNKLCCD